MQVDLRVFLSDCRKLDYNCSATSSYATLSFALIEPCQILHHTLATEITAPTTGSFTETARGFAHSLREQQDASIQLQTGDDGAAVVWRWSESTPDP